MKRMHLRILAVSIFAATVAQFAHGQSADDVQAVPADGQEVKYVKDIPRGPFHPFIRCLRARGQVEVLRPVSVISKDGGASRKWEPAIEDRYYPLGSSFRGIRRRLPSGEWADVEPHGRFMLGPDSIVEFRTCAEFGTREGEYRSQKRQVILVDGKIDFNLSPSLSDDSFCAVSPAYSLENGRGSFSVNCSRSDGAAGTWESVVSINTGTVTMKGANFTIKELNAANQLRVRSTDDGFYVSLTGVTGDIPVTLDNGIERTTDPITKKHEDKAVTSTFELMPHYMVKIWRQPATVTGKFIVSTTAFDDNGSIKSRRTFAEGRYNVNSGEQVVSKETVAEAEEMKRKSAAAVTETVDVDIAPAADDEAKPAQPAEAPKPEEKDSDEQPSAGKGNELDSIFS